MKKRFCVLLLAIFTVFGLSACGGDPYEKVKLTVSNNELHIAMVENENNELVGEPQRVMVEVSAPKSLSKDIELPKYGNSQSENYRLGDEFVSIEVKENDGAGKYILEFNGIKTGYTEIPVKTVDGNRTEIIKVHIDVEVTGMQFKTDKELVCEEGGKLDLTQFNTRNYIDFAPSATSQTDVIYYISDETRRLYTGNPDNLIKNNILDLSEFQISSNSDLVDGEGNCYIKLSARSAVEGKEEINTKDTYLRIKVIRAFKFRGNINFAIGSCSVAPDAESDDQIEYNLLFANPNSTNGESSSIGSLDDKAFFGGQITISLNYTDYKITVDDLRNEIIGVTKTSTTISGSATTFVFDVIPKEAGEQTLVFKVDYTGGKSGDEYDGLFTRKIIVNFKVSNVPTAINLQINDEAYNPDKLIMVFKDYSGTFGTKFKVYDSSATDMTFKINTQAADVGVYDENGVTVVTTGAGNGTELANGTVLYLRSNSNETGETEIVLTMTSKFYTDNYSGPDKTSQVYTKDIIIKIHISASISDFRLEDKAIVIEKSADLQPTLIYEFVDEKITARDVIAGISLTNSSSGRITFEDNKIFFTPNFRLDKYFTPMGTSLTLRMITGISASCRINVGLKYINDETSNKPLLVLDVDKTNSGYFASWNSDAEAEGLGDLTSSVGETFSLNKDSIKYTDINGLEHTYTFFDYLVLATNTTINFDVYRLFIYNGNVEKVAVNLGVDIYTNSSYVRWVNDEGGKLITTDKTTSTTNDNRFVSTPLEIHIAGFENPVIVNTYVFEKINSAKLNKNTFTVYDATNLKDADIAKAFAEIQLKLTTAYGDDMFSLENYGNLYQNYTMTNASSEVVKLGTTSVSYGDLVGAQKAMSFIEIDGTRYYRIDGEGFVNWYRTIFDAYAEKTDKTIPNLDGLKYVNYIAGEASSTYYFLNEKWYASIDDIIYETLDDPRYIEDNDLLSKLNLLSKLSFRLNTIYTYEAKLSEAVSAENREALVNAIFREGYVEVVFRGAVKQFNNVFEGNNFVLRIYNPTKSTSIKTNINKENGLYLETDGDKYTSFTYEILPTNTFNKDVFVEITDVKTGEKVNVSFAIFKNGTSTFRNYRSCGEYINGNYNNAEPLFRVEVKNNQITVTYLGTTAGTYICTIGAVDQISDGQFNLKTEFNINIADGSQENPYQIRSRSDFEKYLQTVKRINGENEYISGKYFVLANDIVLNNVISNPEFVLRNNLSGVFTKYLSADEKTTYKYKIYGLNMLFTDTTKSSFGLFASVKAGITLDHINFENVTVTVRGQFDSEINVGIIAGYVDQNITIKNSRVNGTITVVQNGTGAVNVGGMFGKTTGKLEITGAPSESTINNSNINANVAISVSTIQRTKTDGDGKTFEDPNVVNIGGIIGLVAIKDGQYANVNEVNVLARLTALKYEKANSTSAMDFAKANIGGVVGYAPNITISQAIVYPVIAGHSNIGGIAGYVQNAEISDSQVQMLYNINMKNIIAGYGNIGGIIGTAENARLEYDYVRSYTSQDINTYDGNIKVMEAMTSRYLGALVLLLNYAPDEFTNGQYVGGLVGAVTKQAGSDYSIEINNSYFNSHIASNAYDSKEKAGAFVGYKSVADTDAGTENATIKIENSYFDGKANLNNMLKLVYADAITVADADNREYTSEPTTYTYNILGDKDLNTHGNYIVVQQTAVSKTTFKINETLDGTVIKNVYAKLNDALFTIENSKPEIGSGDDRVSYFGLTTKVSESTIIVFRNNNQLRLAAYRRDLASSPLADSYDYYRLDSEAVVTNLASFKVELLQSLIGYNFVSDKSLKAISKAALADNPSETQDDIAKILAVFGGEGTSLNAQVANINALDGMKKVEGGDYPYNQSENATNVVYNESFVGEIYKIEKADTYIPFIKFTYDGTEYYINSNNLSNVYSDEKSTRPVSDFNNYWLVNIPTQNQISVKTSQVSYIDINEDDNINIDGNNITGIYYIANSADVNERYVGKAYYYSGTKMFVYGDVIAADSDEDTYLYNGKLYNKLIKGSGMITNTLYQYGGYESGYSATTPMEEASDSIIYYYKGNPTVVVKTANSVTNPNGTVSITIGGVEYTLENGVLVDADGQEFNLAGGNRYYVNEKLNINIENKVLTNDKILNIFNILNNTEYTTIQELFTANGFKNFDGEIYLVFKYYYTYTSNTDNTGPWFENYDQNNNSLSGLIDDASFVEKLKKLPKIDLGNGISCVEITEFEIEATFGISSYYTSDDPTSEYYDKWYKKYEKLEGGVEQLSEEITDDAMLAKLNSATSNFVEDSTKIKYVSFNVWQYDNNDISDQFVIDMLDARKVQEVQDDGNKYYYSAHWYSDASHRTAVIDSKVLAKLENQNVASGESYILKTTYYQNGDGWVDENGNTVSDSETIAIISGLSIKTADDGRKYVEYEKTYYYYAYWADKDGNILNETADAELITRLEGKLDSSTTVGSATVKLYKNGDNWSYDEKYVGGDDYHNNAKDEFIINKAIGTTNLQQDFSFVVPNEEGVPVVYYLTVENNTFTVKSETGGAFGYTIVRCENNILIYRDNAGNSYSVVISSGLDAHKWVITNKINGGLPIMIKPYLTIVNESPKEGEQVGAESKYELWFDTLATLNLIVNDFAVDETTQKYYVIDGDEELQGHILYNSDTAILMYNTPSSSGDSRNLNSYKMSYGITSDGYYVASINGKILEISALKINADTASQMIVASNNQDVVYVDTSNDSYITIQVRNIGQATLTFYNLKDDGINVKFNIVVVRGFTDFVVKQDSTSSAVTDFNLTVGVAEDYSFGFENTLNDINYPANTSGFQVVVKSVDGNTNISTETTSSIKFGTDIIDGKMIGKTLDFNYTTTLSLLALNKVGSGEFRLTVTPFVIYNNEKVFVSSLAKDITINAVVEALNVMFSEDESKISAQNEKEVSLIVYSNNGDGLQTVTLSANGIKDILVDVSGGYNTTTNLVENSTSEASLLKIRLKNYEFVKDNNVVGEVAIHRHIFTFVLSMNLEEYLNIYSQGNNPLYYDKEFAIKATSGSKESTFNFTIAPNPVSTLDAYFYPVVEESGNAFEQSDIWAIAPGKQGILKLEITPDYNNVLMVEVELDAQYLNYVDVSQQYISSIDLATSNVTYSKLSTTNTLVGNKIVLWNTLVDYPSLFNQDINEVNILDMSQGEYYLLLNFRTTMPQNVNFPITVNLYDKDRNIIVTETKQLFVESFPKITATLDKYSDGIIGKGEIVPLTITAQNINSDISWNLRSSDGTEINNVLYYMDNKGQLQPVLASDSIDVKKKYYIDTTSLSYGRYTLNFAGNREINKTTFSASETLNLQVVVFTLEDVSEIDVNNGVITIKNATTKILKADVTLNPKAYSTSPSGLLTVTEYEKYNALINAISGYDDGINWEVATTNGYEKLLSNKIYSGFKFLTENGYCKIKSLSKSTNNFRLSFHYYYDINGDIVITNQYNIDSYTVYMFDYYFTIEIEDNSTEDHPNPINTQADLENMQEGASYILQNDIDLISWKPIDFKANYLDGNGYTLNIKSFDLTDETGSNEAYVGVFRIINEGSIVKNLNINISALLVSSTTYNAMKKETVNPNIDLRKTELVYFGVLAGSNEGTVINVKVVNFNLLDNNSYLYVALSTGYYSVDGSQNLSTGYVGGLVGQNLGVIADSMVGVRNSGYITTSVSTNSSSKQTRVSGFKLAGSNRVAGFTAYNTGTISNSFISDLSIVNNATITRNAFTAGFVGQNTGKVYSCAVTTNTLDGFRSARTTIESLVSVGGFVYLNTGRVEDCYTNIQIYNVSTQTAGFVYENGANGEIINVYTTSKNTAIDKNSTAHSLFVSVKPMAGTLKNCYYAIINNELGLGVDADLEILRTLDPAIGLNLITNSIVAQSYFTGFTFASDKSSVDGVWLYDENTLPTLAICENVEIYTCRELLSAPSAYFTVDLTDKSVSVYDVTYASVGSELEIKDVEEDGKTKKVFTYYGIQFTINLNADNSINNISSLLPISGETMTLVSTIRDGKTYYRYSDTVATQNGTETLFNYSYTQNNPGSRNNPLVVTTAEEFAKYIVTNTQKRDGKYVFGGTTDDGDSSTARYVKVVSDLDFSDNKITSKYKISGSNDQISISDIIFNGVLIGNSMTLSNIYLVNERADESENWGIFSQIGLGATDNSVPNAFVFNLKLSYREVSSESSRKVGVLAGTINNATITKIDIVGPQNSNESDVVSGKYLVGGLAGLIIGDNTKISEITASNVRVMANYVTDTSSNDNEAFNLTENFMVDDVRYNSFSYTDINQREHKIDINLSQYGYNIVSDWKDFNISYAGAIAGMVVGTSGIETNYLESPSIYKMGDKDPTYVDLRAGRTTIQNLTVKDKLAVNSMVSGGVFGYLGGKETGDLSEILIVKDIKLELNSDNLGQSVFGMAYAGGLVGYSYKSALIESRVEHSESVQETIDAQINTISAGNISANDFFVNSLGDGATRNIAIGGLVGYTNNVAIVDSYSKLNVVNTNSFIAGGLVGQSVNKLYMAYDYTIGNVDASTIIGGVIGYKLYENKAIGASKTDLYNSQNLYLINVVGVNVWSNNVIDYVNQNNDFLQKGGTHRAELSMFEIGNFVGDYTYSQATTSSRFRYLGSLIGRANHQGLGVSVSDEVAGNIINKDNIGAHYVFDTNADRVVSYRESFVGGGKEEHYETSYTTYFFNVISSTYGTVSHTGSLNNDNYTSVINPNSLTLYDRSVVHPLNDEGKENTLVNIETYNSTMRVGKQYYVSYITGDFLNSNPKEDASGVYIFGSFKNEFINNWGFVTNISDYAKGDISGAVFETSANVKASTVWYVDTNLYLPKYGYNTSSNVIEISNSSELKTALTYGYKDKIYKINKYVFKVAGSDTEVVANADLIACADNAGGVSGSFRYNETTYTYEVINYSIDVDNKDVNLSSCVFFADSPVTVNVILGGSDDGVNRNGMYNILSGCSFTNINFNINATNRVNGGIGTSHREGYLGLFANNVSGCTFTNCQITVTVPANVNFIATETGALNVTTYGHIVGRVYRSTFTGCGMVVVGGTNITSDKKTIANIGGIFGNLVYATIDTVEYSVGETKITINSNQETVSIGGFAGISQGSVIRNITATDESITASLTRYAANTKLYIGGVIGRMITGGSTLSSSKFNKIKISNISLDTAPEVDTKPTHIGIGAVVGSSESVAYSDIEILGCTLDVVNNNVKTGEYIGLLVGYSLADTINNVFTGAFESTNFSKINYTFVDASTVKNNNKFIGIGGIVGYSNNTIQKARNTANIKISVKADDTKNVAKSLLVGGIVGYFDVLGDIENSYNMGNIDLACLAGGNSTNYAILGTMTSIGGIAGQSSKSITLTNVANYGDILYDEQANDKNGTSAKANNNFKIGGIIGYTTASLKMNGVMDYTRFYAYSDCTEFDGVKNVNIKKNALLFSAITNGLKLDNDSTNNYYFVSEFDPATASNGGNVNLVNNNVSYGLLLDFNMKDSSGNDLLVNTTADNKKHYIAMFKGIFDSYDTFYEQLSLYTSFNDIENKNNPLLVNALTSNIKAGTYNVYTCENVTTSSSGLNIGKNAILTSNKTNGDFYITINSSGTALNLFNENNGVISNILFKFKRDPEGATLPAGTSYVYFINTNNGMLYNVAFASGLTDDDVYTINVGQSQIKDNTISGISVVQVNNGGIYKSGTLMVFSKDSRLKDDSFSNFVLVNNGTIAESYTTSKYNGTIVSGVDFGALCHTNNGIIKNCLAGGRFGQTYVGDGVKAVFTGSGGSAIATCSDGEISEFVMKSSSYKYSDSDLNNDTNKSIWVVKNGNFNINEGYPYIRNGIEIPTDPFGLEEVNIQTVAELKNMLTAFNAYTDMSGAVKAIGSEKTQTVTFDITKDSKKPVDRSFRLNINKNSVVTGKISDITLPNALIASNSGTIKDLSLNYVNVKYSSVDSNIAAINEELNGGEISNITVNNSNLTIVDNTKTYYAGFAVGIIKDKSKIDKIKIDDSFIFGSPCGVGGVVGYVDNTEQELTNLSYSGYITSGARYVGGIIGYANIKGASDLTVLASIGYSYSKTRRDGYTSVGGIVGYSESTATYKNISFNASNNTHSGITIVSLKDDRQNMYVGGLIGLAYAPPIKSGYWKVGCKAKQMTIYLGCVGSKYNVGGLFGYLWSGKNVKYNLTDESNILIKADKAERDRSVRSSSTYFSGKTIREVFFSGYFYEPLSEYDSGITWEDFLSFRNSNEKVRPNYFYTSLFERKSSWRHASMRSRVVAIENAEAMHIGRVAGYMGATNIEFNLGSSFYCKLESLKTYYAVMRLNVIEYSYGTSYTLISHTPKVSHYDFVLEERLTNRFADIVDDIDDKLTIGNEYVRSQVIDSNILIDEKFKPYIGANDISANWKSLSTGDNSGYSSDDNWNYHCRVGVELYGPDIDEWIYGTGKYSGDLPAIDNELVY